MKNAPSFRPSQIAFFASLCLFLSVIEYAVPKPLPFMRLGLANLPVLLSVRKMDARGTLLLVLLKVLLQSLVGGTLISYVFLFSLSGSLASALAILALYRLGGRGAWVSNVGLSLAGALANNLAQLLCARFVLFGNNVRYIAPLLLAVGLATGLALGIFANLFEARSVWYADYGDRFPAALPMVAPNCPERHILIEGIRFFSVFLLMIAMLFTKKPGMLWTFVLVFFMLSLVRQRGKVRILPSLVIVASVTCFALLSPHGKVLFTLGGWRLTEGALSDGLRRSGVLVGMMFASKNMVGRDTVLPGAAGRLTAQVFALFEELTARRVSLRPGYIIAAIDGRLMEIYLNYLQKIVL